MLKLDTLLARHLGTTPQQSRRGVAEKAPKAPQEKVFSPDTFVRARAAGQPATQAPPTELPVSPEKDEAPAQEPDADSQLIADRYQQILGHAPSDDDVTTFKGIMNDLRSQNFTEDEVRDQVDLTLKTSEEYRTQHVDDLINDLYQWQLQRPVDDEGLATYRGMAQDILAKGGNGQDVQEAILESLQSSEEYQALNAPAPEPAPDDTPQDTPSNAAPDAPTDTPQAPAETPETPAAPTGPSTNRSDYYLQQPNGWSCGPTSLSMALSALGLRRPNAGTIQEMINMTGANPRDGLPGNASLIAATARRAGAQAQFVGDSSPASIRAALQRGHGVVVNGHIGSTGHFAYIAGIADDGRFIVGDPYRPGLTRMTDAELNAFANGNNPHGFAEIWR